MIGLIIYKIAIELIVNTTAWSGGPFIVLDGDIAKPEFDELAEEAIVSILNNNEVVVRLLATQDLEDLAVGHIACEGRGIVEDIMVDHHEITISGSIRKGLLMTL